MKTTMPEMKIQGTEELAVETIQHLKGKNNFKKEQKGQQ